MPKQYRVPIETLPASLRHCVVTHTHTPLKTNGPIGTNPDWLLTKKEYIDAPYIPQRPPVVSVEQYPLCSCGYVIFKK